MTGMAVLPLWVQPTTADVETCHRRAHELAPTLVFARPITAALDWVTGLDRADAPVTARPLPPTEAAARAEMMLATAVGVLGQDRLGDDLWSILGVPPAPPATGDGVWLGGAAATLGWLLGVHVRPPLPLPHHVDVGV